MFSGLETPSVALHHIGISAKLRYAVELDPHLNSFIQTRWKPKVCHKDACDVKFKKLPGCDLLVAGPPCQSFARGGNHGGVEDDRGKLIFKVVENVEARNRAGKSMPSAVVLEQSKLLLGKYRFVYDEIESRMQKLGYTVRAKILDTYEH